MIMITMIGYLIIAKVIYNDYRKVKLNYIVQRNGFRYVIRNKQGKFVKMPRNNIAGFFTMLCLAYEDR